MKLRKHLLESNEVTTIIVIKQAVQYEVWLGWLLFSFGTTVILIRQNLVCQQLAGAVNYL